MTARAGIVFTFMTRCAPGDTYCILSGTITEAVFSTLPGVNMFMSVFLWTYFCQRGSIATV